MQRSTLAKIGLTAAVVLGGGGFLVKSSLGNAQHYMMVHELIASGIDQWKDKELKVHGLVEAKSIVEDTVDQETRRTFVLEKEGKKIRVFSEGPKPDTFKDHAPTLCERCGLAFSSGAERELIGEYDEIELPPVRPFVTRHRRYAIRCSCCEEPTRGLLPAVAQATPFGPRIHALAIYLKTTQLFSYQRLACAFGDLFVLQVSEDALMNMFARRAPLMFRR